MIDETEDLQETIQANIDTTAITCDYMSRFMPDEGIDVHSEEAGYNIEGILSDRK